MTQNKKNQGSVGTPYVNNFMGLQTMTTATQSSQYQQNTNLNQNTQSDNINGSQYTLTDDQSPLNNMRQNNKNVPLNQFGRSGSQTNNFLNSQEGMKSNSLVSKQKISN